MLLYLWKRRCIAGFFSKAWFKLWAKRVLLLNRLLDLSIRRFYLRASKIDRLVIIENIHIDGDLENIIIGEGSFLGSGALLAAHDSIQIGKNVAINRGAKILTASHDVDDPNWALKKAPIIIEDYCWIATGAVLLPGTLLRQGAVVGAGAVVSGEVNAGAVVVGNPGKVIKNRACKDFLYKPAYFSALFDAWLGRGA